MGLQGDFAARVSPPDAPRAAPLSRAEGSYNVLRIAGSQERDLTRHGPEARRIFTMDLDPCRFTVFGGFRSNRQDRPELEYLE